MTGKKKWRKEKKQRKKEKQNDNVATQLLRNAKGYVKILYTAYRVHCDCESRETQSQNMLIIFEHCVKLNRSITMSMVHQADGRQCDVQHENEIIEIKVKWRERKKNATNWIRTGNGLTARLMTITLKCMWPAQLKWSGSVRIGI